MMKKNFWLTVLVATTLMSTMSGCEVIGGIFKAGVWTGSIIVIFVIALVIFIAVKLFSGKKN